MYRNLKAEMIRANIASKDIAELLGIRYGAVINRLNGRNRFYLDEAFKIQSIFFPQIDIKYLFEIMDNVA